jgi:hypothetical protein
MNINQKDIYAVTAYTIDNNPESTKSLIRKYGVVLPANASKADIDKAFSALLKTSKTFRRDFAALAQESISNNNNFLEFLNFGHQNFVQEGKAKSLDDIFLNAAAGGQAGSASDPAKKSNKEGVSWSDYLDPDTVKRVINTGLNVWATREGTTADTANNINQGRLDIPNNPQTPPTAKGGMGTGTIVLIVVGVLGALGAVVYFATKKK